MKLKDILSEGTWSVPATEKIALQLKHIMASPLPAKDATNKLYDILGDDDLFDRIDDAKNKDPSISGDVRGLIKNKLAQILQESCSYSNSPCWWNQVKHNIHR